MVRCEGQCRRHEGDGSTWMLGFGEEALVVEVVMVGVGVVVVVVGGVCSGVGGDRSDGGFGGGRSGGELLLCWW